MIEQRCDLCKRKTTNLKSIVLHKKTFDYCDLCKEKAEKIKEDFKKEVKQEYLLFEIRIKKVEQNFYNNRIR